MIYRIVPNSYAISKKNYKYFLIIISILYFKKLRDSYQDNLLYNLRQFYQNIYIYIYTY